MTDLENAARAAESKSVAAHKASIRTAKAADAANAAAKAARARANEAGRAAAAAWDEVRAARAACAAEVEAADALNSTLCADNVHEWECKAYCGPDSGSEILTCARCGEVHTITYY